MKSRLLREHCDGMRRVLLALHDTERSPGTPDEAHSKASFTSEKTVISFKKLTENSYSLRGGTVTVKVILKLSLSPSSDTPVMFSVCDPGENLFTSNTNVPFSSAPVGGRDGIHYQRSSWVDKESANRSPL